MSNVNFFTFAAAIKMVLGPTKVLKVNNEKNELQLVVYCCCCCMHTFVIIGLYVYIYIYLISLFNNMPACWIRSGELFLPTN